ncbi:hypothetical protein [Azospirillum sp. B4]|uniref:hypothetical protein n=1 Tax=Azospirillum sp. B4 TaxID=95605 RepID=UPI00131F0423|nr:hypothetical protein [Azospirillum sp. B4]
MTGTIQAADRFKKPDDDKMVIIRLFVCTDAASPMSSMGMRPLSALQRQRSGHAP